MSFQLFEQDTLFLQRFLKSAGFYEAYLDGIFATGLILANVRDKFEEGQAIV